MKATNFILDDPVVREVRAARARLWRAGGGTVSGFMQVVKEVARGKRSRSGPAGAGETELRKRGQIRKRRHKAKRSKVLSS